MLQVIKGRIVKPRRIVFHGVAGIGKGTWAAGAPSPIFIQTEDGNDSIGVDRTPVRVTLTEVQQDLRAILLDDHDYRTLVIDTLDNIDVLIQTAIAVGAGADTIGDIDFGRGYLSALKEFRKILFMLDKIRDVRGMTIILICHTKVTKFDDPSTDAYDRYGLQMHAKTADEVMGWADEVLFANYKTFVRTSGSGFKKRNVAAGAGDRVIFTREMPSYYAKNRLDLPPELPMPKEGGWDVFAQYLRLDPTPTQAAGAEGAVVTQPGSSEPAVQAPAAVPPDPAVQSAAVPEAVAEAAAILGMDVPDLDAMDVDQLRDFGLSLAPKFSKSRAASMRAAIKARNAEKMREIIRYVMTKPDVSGVSGED
jgi:hypothetical protein